ncbi:TPA: hypothetical protein J0587_004683 [Salmonella enterica subsp. enterica serovar Kentucky]|nr:hypothetical protein [Salmonella enterica subsp. enterica serovar Kentucky]
MATIKFKSGEIRTLRTEQIKVMQCGKLRAPFGLAAMRECEIIEYIK